MRKKITNLRYYKGINIYYIIFSTLIPEILNPLSGSVIIVFVFFYLQWPYNIVVISCFLHRHLKPEPLV